MVNRGKGAQCQNYQCPNESGEWTHLLLTVSLDGINSDPKITGQLSARWNGQMAHTILLHQAMHCHQVSEMQHGNSTENNRAHHTNSILPAKKQWQYQSDQNRNVENQKTHDVR